MNVEIMAIVSFLELVCFPIRSFCILIFFSIVENDCRSLGIYTLEFQIVAVSRLSLHFFSLHKMRKTPLPTYGYMQVRVATDKSSDPCLFLQSHAFRGFTKGNCVDVLQPKC